MQDCILGREILPQNMSPILGTTYEYYEETVGNVKVTDVAYKELMHGDFERYIIAGITRNAYENKQEPPLITSQFINHGYKELNPPMTFNDKSQHLLKYLYDHGGNENVSFQLNSTKDFPLAYAEPEEFSRIIGFLEKNNWIDIRKTHKIGSMASQRVFMGVELSISGINKIEEDFSEIPLIGLVEQRIKTGNVAVDEKINHAKDLFFKEGATLNDKRSACETLSYILEPLRNDLTTFFSASDVSDFFQIVNRFDIRHNKSTTINLIHEEQFDWVFYSLLNTINTFVKLKKKIST